MLKIHELRPIQAMALNLFFKYRRLILILPRQEGKTELGVRINQDLLERRFTKSTLFLAKDRKAANKAAREKFVRLFPETDFQVNTQCVFNKHCKTSIGFIDSVDKDPDRIRGGTNSYIHWTEVAFSKFENQVTTVDVVQKVIMPTTDKTNGLVLLESTTHGKNSFYDFCENRDQFGFHLFRVSLGMMVDWGLVSREYYDAKKKTTLPDIFNQEYECQFITFKGKAYAEFDERIHVIDVPRPERWQKVIIGVDWGYSPSATCALFGYVKDGVTFIFAEHYAMEEKAIHTAEKIGQIIKEYDIYNYAAVADHEQDRIDELIERKIECSKADKVNVLGNRLQIKEKFFRNELYIDKSCPRVIKDLGAAVWDGKKDGELDDSQCAEGHFDAEAALRYLIRELSSLEEDKPVHNPHADMDAASERAWEMLQHRRLELDH